MTTYEITSPTRIPLQTQHDKVKYFVNEIFHYVPVLTRPRNTLPPPVFTVTGQTFHQIRNILSVYTLKELIDAYDPAGAWSNREELIGTILNETYDRGLAGLRWSWRHRFCNNDDTINIITADRHGDINKDDLEDPTLSYGIHKNYRCYQVSELTAAFRNYDGMFIFRVPDWTVGTPLIAEFPEESIRQLQQLLLTTPPEYNVDELIAKIQEGLAFNTNTMIIVRTLKTQYDAFTPEQQYLAKLYLAWLFLYGMWMRFWKGPGFPWPTFQVQVTDTAVREKGLRCGPEDRDEHAFIQQAIRTVFVETYEKDLELRIWINSLPRVQYNFQSGEANIDRGPINDVLDRLMLGNECQGFAGDTVTQTAYYLITRMFNLNKMGAFDEFMAEMMPSILNIEQQVVNNQLAAIKNPNVNDEVRIRVRVLRQRQAALAQPVPKQPIFEPARVEHNVHT